MATTARLDASTCKSKAEQLDEPPCRISQS
jgi:hypothetical protein